MGLISRAAERFGRRPSPTWLLPGLGAAVAAAEQEQAKSLTAAALADQMLAEEFGGERELLPQTSPYQLTILRALNVSGKHVYGGTVRPNVKARRRAKNKVASATRRLSRQRAR